MSQLTSFETILRRRAELGGRMAAQKAVTSQIPTWVDHAVAAAGGDRYANQLGGFVKACIGPDFHSHHAVLSAPINCMSEQDTAWRLSYELVNYALESALAGAGVQVSTDAERRTLDRFGTALLTTAANAAPRFSKARRTRPQVRLGATSRHLSAMRTLAGAIRIAECKRTATTSDREVAELAGVAALGYAYASAKQPAANLLPAYTIAFALAELERDTRQNPAFVADLTNRLAAAFKVLPVVDAWSQQYVAYAAPRLAVLTA